MVATIRNFLDGSAEDEIVTQSIKWEQLDHWLR